MIRKRFRCIFLLCFILVYVNSITAHANTTASPVLSQTSSTMFVNEKQVLTLKNVSTSLKWVSSNKNIITIISQKNNTVSIKAKKTGSAIIKTKYKGKWYSCKVSVKKIGFRKTVITPTMNVKTTVTLKGTKSVKSVVVNYSKLNKQSSKKNVIYWSVVNKNAATIKVKSKNSITITTKTLSAVKIVARYKGKNYILKAKSVAKSISFNPSNLIIYQGNTKSLHITGLNTTDPVTWTSSNPSIIKLTGSGSDVKLSALNIGSSTIRFKYANRTYSFNAYVPISKDIPYYFTSEIATSISSFNARANSSLSKFIFFTDSHWGDNAQHSPAIINYLSKRLSIPFTIFGGDIVTYSYAEKSDAEAEISDFYSKFTVPVLSVTGNHDYNEYKSSSAIMKQTDLYGSIYKKEENYKSVNVNIFNQGEGSYFDDAQRKVRYILFSYDSTSSEHYVSAELNQWIGKRITELETGWTVLLFSHEYLKVPNYPSESKSTIAVHAKTKELAEDLLKYDKESKADVAVWMTGHRHIDYNTLIKNSDETEQIQVICSNCDAYGNGQSSWGGPAMTKGTCTEQSLDLVQVDTKNRKIYLTRVGAGKDRVLSY